MRRGGPAGRIVRVLLVMLVMALIGRAVVRDWHVVRDYDWRVDPVGLACAVAVFSAAYAFLAWTWGRVLEAVGCQVGFREAWRIYFIGNLGRYVPGKIWTIAGVAWMAGKTGIPPLVAGTAAVCAQAYAVVSSFVFFLLFLILRDVGLDRGQVGAIVLAGLAVCALFMSPRLLGRVVDMVTRITGRGAVTIPLATTDALRLTGLYILSWLLFGLGFTCFVHAVTGGDGGGFLLMTGSYAVAYVVGFLALFAPGGIGVREGVLALLLADVLPGGVAAVVAVAVRLLVTVIELACVAVSPLLVRERRG